MASLRFETISLVCGDLGRESTVPDIVFQKNVQNKTRFQLDEFDEIYEGYGQVPSAYPYRQQDSYSRATRVRQTQAAILENEFLSAVFLPEYGGRLWKLWDKLHNVDLVYENDCLRPSNLAVRNAWFSGGVEWNCGIIGHTPFTMDRIFAARVREQDRDILRMYAYERIRGVVYQMDFWLDDEEPALNCHMSVHNPSRELVPMYWWTNIASPLYPGGRLLVPAHKAYSYDGGTIVKVDTPVTKEGWDVSDYGSIPISKDYFFSLDPGAPRWIANVDRDGRGMIHLSTQRLQSRKLFVWGQNDGALHWQEFLTEKAGPYIEMQAGLGKTQYGCIPMAPHTTWEWSERFEFLELSREQQTMDFEQAISSLNAQVSSRDTVAPVEALGAALRAVPGELVLAGTGDGQLQDKLRKAQGLPPMRPYLDFTSPDPRQKPWSDFLDTGILTPPEEGFPAWDPCGSQWLELLEASVRKPKGRNWYAYYCISLLQWQAGRYDLAEKAVARSLKLRETACGDYAAAVYQMNRGKKKQAAELVCRGLDLGRKELSYARACLNLLIRCGAWDVLLEQAGLLTEEQRQTPRIRLDCVYGLYKLGRYPEAMELLLKDGGLQLDDVREGDILMGELWRQLNRRVNHNGREIPHAFNFNASNHVQEI